MVSGDRGAAGLLVLIAGMAIVAVTAVAGALVAGALVHSRVEAAADMVALAAAGRLLTDPQPCEVAATVAADNDVRLVACQVEGLAVSITVEAALPPVLTGAVGDRRARARARAEVVALP